MKTILEHGAIGNGIDDDTNAIQRAINEGGAEFPSGNFKFSKTLKIKNSCKLIGCNTKLFSTNYIQNAISIRGLADITLDNIMVESVSHTILTNVEIGRPTVLVFRLKLNNCTFIGHIVKDKITTNYLINLDSSQNLLINNFMGAKTQDGIKLGDFTRDCNIKDVWINNWLRHGISIWAGSNGNYGITLDNVNTKFPLKGNGPRQSIVVYGDPKYTSSVTENIKLLNCTAMGSAQPWDQLNSANNLGTADQIVLHRCHKFLLQGCNSFYGGENGFTITRFCEDGKIMGCSAWENDAHGLQVSGENDQCNNIIIAQNHLYNNGLRKDGKGDVMAELYCQDGEDILIDGNLLEDRFQKRQCRSGVSLALCKNVRVTESNMINFKDKIGYTPVLNYSTRF